MDRYQQLLAKETSELTSVGPKTIRELIADGYPTFMAISQETDHRLALVRFIAKIKAKKIRAEIVQWQEELARAKEVSPTAVQTPGQVHPV